MIYKNIKIPIPDYVMYIIKILHIINKDVYVVGGSIRDYFLGKEPHDWDLVVNESPDISYKLFSTNRNISITTAGIEHGTIKLWVGDHEPIDLTEFGNNPKYVNINMNKLYNPTIYDDISRRDFTMNALVYSPYNGLIDMHNGLQDIKDHIIKFVDDNPDDRVKNDPFLILRAIRQAITLNFTIDNSAEIIWNYDNIKLLKNVSGWRRGNELRKILDVDYSNKPRCQKLYFKQFLQNVCHYVLFPNDITCDIDMSDRYKYILASEGWEWRLAFILKDYSNNCVMEVLKNFEYDFSNINMIMEFKEELEYEYRNI